MAGYYPPARNFIEPVSFHTWNLSKAIFFTAAVFLIVVGIQDYLDPGRRKIPAVQLKALTAIGLGFFMLYMFFSVLNVSKYGR